MADPEGVHETCNTCGTLKDVLLGQTRPKAIPYNSRFRRKLEINLLSRSLTTQRAGRKFVDGVDYILFTLCFTDDYVFQAML